MMQMANASSAKRSLVGSPSRRIASSGTGGDGAGGDAGEDHGAAAEAVGEVAGDRGQRHHQRDRAGLQTERRLLRQQVLGGEERAEEDRDRIEGGVRTPAEQGAAQDLAADAGGARATPATAPRPRRGRVGRVRRQGRAQDRHRQAERHGEQEGQPPRPGEHLLGGCRWRTVRCRAPSRAGCRCRR